MPTSPRERRNSSYIGFGRRATPAQKTLVVQKLRQKYSLNLLLSIAQLPRATFYYHLKQMQKEDKYASVKEEITTIYHQEFQSMEHFKQELIEYMDYYNNHRIKAKLKGLPPAIHRQQALSAA